MILWTCLSKRTLLYLSNGHQAFGFAGGIDGPVRTLQHHRWPFDIEQQLVFSTIADVEVGDANGDHQKGIREIDFSGQGVTGATEFYGDNQKHKAIITYFEACWMTAISGANPSADSSLMTQSISSAAKTYMTYSLLTESSCLVVMIQVQDKVLLLDTTVGQVVVLLVQVVIEILLKALTQVVVVSNT